MPSASDHNVAILDEFLSKNPAVKFIWIQNHDYSGLIRQRMLPVAAFKNCLATGSYPGITECLPDLLFHDLLPEGTSVTGEMKTVPDMASIIPNTVIPSASATVQSWWMEDEDHQPSNHHFSCPRWALQKHVDALKAEYNITMLMGFEIEVCFMEPVYDTERSTYKDFTPVASVHSWSSMTYQDLEILPMIEKIVESLAEVGIYVPMFHAESAPGQWEFPLPAFEPVKAIDVLSKAREIIHWTAHKYGLKATLLPRPFNFAAGSASHAHFSINGPDDTVAKYSDPFLAGVLDNLDSIVAFTLSTDESYARVLPGVWAGGEYVCWGTKNKEAPLRKCGPGHWELKQVDGVGNMYLSMAAVVAAGLHGLRSNLPLTCKDNLHDASSLTSKQREELGIKTKLPKELSESLDNLAKNKVLNKMMGEKLIEKYVRKKRREVEFFSDMTDQKRRIWFIARY